MVFNLFWFVHGWGGMDPRLFSTLHSNNFSLIGVVILVSFGMLERVCNIVKFLNSLGLVVKAFLLINC